MPVVWRDAMSVGQPTTTDEALAIARLTELMRPWIVDRVTTTDRTGSRAP